MANSNYENKLVKQWLNVSYALRDGSSVTSNQEECSRAHAAWSYANAQVTDFKLGFLPFSSSNFVFISLEIQLQ